MYCPIFSTVSRKTTRSAEYRESMSLLIPRSVATYSLCRSFNHPRVAQVVVTSSPITL